MPGLIILIFRNSYKIVGPTKFALRALISRVWAAQNRVNKLVAQRRTISISSQPSHQAARNAMYSY